MNRNNDHNSKTNIPENNPSKALDSKREVENSTDEKTDQDFPGYPHYPAKEDIMDQRTDSHRVDVDVENIASGPNTSGVNQRYLAGQDRQKSDDTLTPQPGFRDEDMQDETDYQRGSRGDGSRDDSAAFNSANDEIGTPHNVSNEDLNTDDLPGTDLNEAGSEQR